MLDLKNKKILLGSLFSGVCILLMSNLPSFAWVTDSWPGGCTGAGCYNEVAIINDTTDYYVWVENVWGSAGQRSNPSPVVSPGKKINGDPFYHSRITDNADGFLKISKNINQENPSVKKFDFNSGESIANWKAFTDGPAINITVEKGGKFRDASSSTETQRWTIKVTQVK